MIGIVYSIATGRIRWMLHPDRDSELDAITLRPGEALLKTANRMDVPAAQQIVNATTKKIPAADRYAIIDAQGNVVRVILADPLCGDSMPGYSMVAHATADVGWTYLTGVFTAPVVSAVKL